MPPPSTATLAGTPRRYFYRGRDPARAKSVDDLRAMAHRRLPTFVLEYLEGGSEDEATLARNVEALAQYRLLPRGLIDVSRRDSGVELLGRPTPLPFALAPTGLNALFWYEADRLLAEAAADAAVPFIQSTMSNMALERISRVPRLRHWLQLYVFGERRVREALIARAAEAGCEALVITIDAQTYGNREWSRRLFHEPGKPRWRTMMNAALHPRWLATTLVPQLGMPTFENIIDYVPEDQRGFFESAFWVRGAMDRGLDWDVVAEIRRLWPRALFIKGLLHVQDVRRAASAGVDGVILSNHGGRQLDWSISAIDCLPAARAAIGAGTTLIVDGGIRRGTDVLKALALGADAVLVGRALLYGVSAAGGTGASRAIEILREEIDRALALVGAASVKELGPAFVARLSEADLRWPD